VLAPLPGYTPGGEPGNNDSLVFRLAQGSSSVFFEGDAEAPIEEGMLAEADLQSTLLKVGHHGSKTSTRPEFLARVAPRWAAVSCGRHNRYGHPAMQTLEDLQAAHVRTLSTDTAGALCFLLKGNEVRLDPECSGKE
jgi:competence protein ComEC